jgi:hypothetical protein
VWVGGGGGGLVKGACRGGGGADGFAQTAAPSGASMELHMDTSVCVWGGVMRMALPNSFTIFSTLIDCAQGGHEGGGVCSCHVEDLGLGR